MAPDTKRLLDNHGKGIQAAGPSRGGKLVVAEVAWHRPKKHLDPVGNSDRIHVSNVPSIGWGVNPKTRSTSPISATLRMPSILIWSVVIGGLSMIP